MHRQQPGRRPEDEQVPKRLLVTALLGKIEIAQIQPIVIYMAHRLSGRLHPDHGMHQQCHGWRPIVHIDNDALLDEALHGVRDAVPIDWWQTLV